MQFPCVLLYYCSLYGHFTRAFYTGSLTYFFYPWNLFLATVPLFFSGLLLKQKTLNYKSIFLLGLWLLFLPNAPYLVTDIFHYQERPPVPMWFDLMLVVSGAWNGVLLCMISLLRVERFLRTRYKSRFIDAIMFVLLLLCGYGIYIGRYLRYNSWDIISDPFSLAADIVSMIFHPFENGYAWGMTLCYAVFITFLYFTIKKLSESFRINTQ